MPEHQTLRMNMLSRSELEFREVDRDYKAAQEELRYLELELSAANAGLATKVTEGSKPASADQAQDLPSLKAEYARLLTRYKDAHPDVVRSSARSRRWKPVVGVRPRRPRSASTWRASGPR